MAVSNWQKAMDESIPFEGSSNGLRKHLIEVHEIANPPLSGIDEGAWLALAEVHAQAHINIAMSQEEDEDAYFAKELAAAKQEWEEDKQLPHSGEACDVCFARDGDARCQRCGISTGGYLGCQCLEGPLEGPCI